MIQINFNVWVIMCSDIIWKPTTAYTRPATHSRNFLEAACKNQNVDLIDHATLEQASVRV